MRLKSMKLLFVIGSIISIAILGQINIFLISNDVFNSVEIRIFDFLQNLIIAMMAGFWGPLIGFMVGCLGKAFGYFSFDVYVLSWFLFGVITSPYDLLKYGLFGLFIGIFCKKYDFSNNVIKIKSILLFCLIKIVSDLLFLDMISWLLSNAFLVFIANIHILILNKIIYTVPHFAILFIYSKIKVKNNSVRPYCT